MKKSLSNQQIAYISRQLAFALNSGISLKAALVFLAGECREKKVALFLQQLGEKISAGQSPGSSILAMNFRLSPLFVEFVLLGEQQGNMALVMEQAAEHFEKQNKLRNMLWTALLYPVLVLSFLLLAIISMLLFVLPSIMQTYHNLQAEIPALTAKLLFFSQWLQQAWPKVMLVGFLLLGILVWQYPRWRYFTDKIPFFGQLYRQYFYIQFAQALGLMLNNGMLLKQSLNALQIIFAQKIYLPQLVKLYLTVDGGDTFAAGIAHCQFIPKLAKQMLSVAAESGQLGICLLRQQEYYQQDLEEKLLRMVKMLEPMLIMFLGLFILLMAGSLFLPLIQSYQYLL